MTPGIFCRQSKKLIVLLAVIVAVVPLSARTHRKRHRVVKQGKPAVQEVTPPNWWGGLPDPMLLLRGKNLVGARIASSVPGISVRRTRISSNGHWAWVWLDIAAAPPQNFDLLVKTLSGQVKIPYELDKRHDPTDGFQGFSPADILYRIEPARYAGGAATVGNPTGKHKPRKDAPPEYQGGNLRGIEERLDYIQQLGATTVETSPLYAQEAKSSLGIGEEHAIDLYRVDQRFGTLQDYEDLAQALHRRGMKLVLDATMNNVGPDSPWVLDPPAPDWFHGTAAHHLQATDDFASIADPHASPAAYRPVLDGWLDNTLPDLNQANPLVSKYLVQNAVWWIESGTLDGIEFDAFPYVNRTFWQDLHRELKALYPHLATIGAIESPDPVVASYFAGGARHAGIDTGLYTPLDFPSYFALRSILTGAVPDGDASMTKLANVQRLDWLYPHPERLVTFFDKPNAASILSTPGATPARLKLAFGLLATMRGTPQIDAGDELAAAGENATGPPQQLAGATSSGNDGPFTAAGRTPQQEAMHAWVQGLLQLRAHYAVLENGTQQNLLADDTGFVFARIGSPPSGKAAASIARGEILLVLVNKSDKPRTFHLDFSQSALRGVRTLVPVWNTKEQESVVGNACDVEVVGEQLVVFEAKRAEASGAATPEPSPSDSPQLR